MNERLSRVLLSKRLIFGIVVGVLLSVFFAQRPLSDVDIAQQFLNRVIVGNFTELFASSKPETAPASKFAEKYAKKYNKPYKKRFTLLIPGIGTSHLELWKAKPCFKAYQRSQIWASHNMVMAMLANKQCWLEHMKLEKGTDPDCIKVRPAKDITNAEYFLGGYWVWRKIIENLTALDYDINDIEAAVYDWRLAHRDLEKRDGYFQELKSKIENKVRHTGLKAVVLTHSMGGLVFYNFIKWVESDIGGKGGDGWVSDHINSIVNIGAPFFGCPKLIAGMLSGEFKDTAQLGPIGNRLLESVFDRAERRDLFWTWLGAFSMSPKGGNRVWGSEWYAPDDDLDRQYQSCFPEYYQSCPKRDFVFYFANHGFHSGAIVSLAEEGLHLTLESIMEVIGDISGKKEEWSAIKSLYSNRYYREKDMNFTSKDQIFKSWTNPLASRLPNMYTSNRTQTGAFLTKEELNNTMKIYCFYGYDKPTERKYFYKNMVQLKENVGSDPQIDVEYAHERSHTINGVQLGDGDGTVNLISLAGACTQAWKSKKYNPSMIPVVVREYKHVEGFVLSTDRIIRGGEENADHIDILGNHELIEDVLRLAVSPPLKVSSRVRKSTLDMTGSLNILD